MKSRLPTIRGMMVKLTPVTAANIQMRKIKRKIRKRKFGGRYTS